MSSDEAFRRVTSERDLAIERFVLMCKAMNQCMWDWDMRTNTVWYSDAIYTVFGIDPATKATFERWTTFLHPEDRERVVAGFREVVERGKSEWVDEYRFVRPSDGGVLDVVDRGFVMFEAGRPVRMVGVVMDVTQQRALENRLQHAQKMQAIGQLAGGIAHDFNNLLQAASLELELLRAVPGSPPKVLAHAKEIVNVVERAAGLTRQLLMFSRAEALRPVAFDLNAKISDLATMLRRLLGDNTKLELELTTGTVSVEADSSMLDQVLVNLAVNARDAMAGSGTLSIKTIRCGRVEPSGRPAGRYVCIEVRDTGAGIPHDIVPHIFEPFFTTKSNGTGLGLATVYGIVEQHRGWIDVESELGRGSTFRVYLAECEPAAKQEATSAHTSTRGHERILLVEDDGGIRRALAALLEGHGYDVVTAESGAAAVATWDAAGGKIDLLVTDLMMAGMNGHELATALTARRSGLGVLIMTGHSRDLDASVPPGYELLHKPFASERFLAAVRARLDRA